MRFVSLLWHILLSSKQGYICSDPRTRSQGMLIQTLENFQGFQSNSLFYHSLVSEGIQKHITMSAGLRVSIGRFANSIVYLQKSTSRSDDRAPKGAAALDTVASGDAARFCRQAEPAYLKCLTRSKSRKVRQRKFQVQYQLIAKLSI